MPARVTSSTTRLASATLRASGFSQAIPRKAAFPRVSASLISSTFAMRVWFGPHSHTASMAGSATMAAIDGNAFAWPTSSRRARAAASSARVRFGLHTPSTSASRTAANACRWNLALKPLPTIPIPRRFAAVTFPVSPFPVPSVWVFDAELGERFRGTALPLGEERVADVAEVLDADPAREEPRGGEVAEAVEEGDAGGVLGLRLLRPGDGVEHRAALGVGAGDERLAVAVVAAAVEPGQPPADRRLQVGIVAEHEVHELGHAGFGGAARARVPGDDQVHELAHRLPLVGGEVLGLVRGAPGQHFVSQSRGFPYRFGGPPERHRERRNGEDAHRFSPTHPVRPSDRPTVRHQSVPFFI